LCGRPSAGTGGAKRSRTDRQNTVRWKSFCHQLRHRLTVHTGTAIRAASAPAAEPAGGESSISITATYTRRPRKRTEAGVVRASQRPQVKLSRQEYSCRTEAGQPRGLRGKSATCKGPAHSGQRLSRASAASCASIWVRKRKKAGSCSAWHTVGVSWRGNRRLPRGAFVNQEPRRGSCSIADHPISQSTTCCPGTSLRKSATLRLAASVG